MDRLSSAMSSATTDEQRDAAQNANASRVRAILICRALGFLRAIFEMKVTLDTVSMWKTRYQIEKNRKMFDFSIL